MIQNTSLHMTQSNKSFNYKGGNNSHQYSPQSNNFNENEENNYHNNKQVYNIDDIPIQPIRAKNFDELLDMNLKNQPEMETDMQQI